MDALEKEYIDQMNDKEKKTMEIAKKILGTSFSIRKSNGFIQFSKNIPKNE